MSLTSCQEIGHHNEYSLNVAGSQWVAIISEPFQTEQLKKTSRVFPVEFWTARFPGLHLTRCVDFHVSRVPDFDVFSLLDSF